MRRLAWLLITLSIGVLVGLLAVTVLDGFQQRDRAVDQQERTIGLLEREVDRAAQARKALGADLDDANRKLDELHSVVEALVAQLAEEGAEPKVSIPQRRTTPTTSRPRAPRPTTTTTRPGPPKHGQTTTTRCTVDNPANGCFVH